MSPLFPLAERPHGSHRERGIFVQSLILLAVGEQSVTLPNNRLGCWVSLHSAQPAKDSIIPEKRHYNILIIKYLMEFASTLPGS